MMDKIQVLEKTGFEEKLDPAKKEGLTGDLDLFCPIITVFGV